MIEGSGEVSKLVGRLQGLRVIEFLKAEPEVRESTGATIRQLCRLFSSGDATRRAAIVSHIRPEFSFAFFWFARTMAEEAVRKSSPEAIWDGVMALIAENYIFDGRETQICLALLYHSSQKLGLDVEGLFSKLSSMAVSRSVAEAVRNFPLRPPERRSLVAFKYQESGIGSSFAYRKVGSKKAM